MGYLRFPMRLGSSQAGFRVIHYPLQANQRHRRQHKVWPEVLVGPARRRRHRLYLAGHKHYPPGRSDVALGLVQQIYRAVRHAPAEGGMNLSKKIWAMSMLVVRYVNSIHLQTMVVKVYC